MDTVRLTEEELAASLVKTFTSENLDQAHVHSLILAHEQFVPSSYLLSALVALYETCDTPKQVKLFGLLKKWIDLQRISFTDPEEGLGKLLSQFITKLLEASKGDEKKMGLANRLKQAISGETILTELNDDEDADDFKPPPVIKKRKRSSDRPEILQYDSEEVARQITIIDHVFMVQVNKQEMIQTRWLEKTKSPTLFARSDRTNHLAYWIAYEILACKPRYRLKMLTHFIRVAGHLMQQHNYQALMGFYLGLNLSPLSVCAAHWQQLPTKVIAVWKKVSKIMDYTNNYANYREEILDADTYTIIPCQEVTLKDLLYYHESSPDFLPNGQIDLQKLHAIGTRIDEFRKCQQSKFHFLKYPALYDLLLSIPTDITVEVLIKISEGEEHNPSTFTALTPRESDSSASNASYLEHSGSEAMSQPLNGSKSARGRSNSDNFSKKEGSTGAKGGKSDKLLRTTKDTNSGKKKLSTALLSKILDSDSQEGEQRSTN